MKIEIELPYHDLGKAYELATAKSKKKIEDEVYDSDDYRSVYKLVSELKSTFYYTNEYDNKATFVFTFEVEEDR